MRRKIIPELQSESDQQLSAPVSSTVIQDVDISEIRTYPAEVPRLNGNQGGTASYLLVPDNWDELLFICTRSVYV